MRPGRQKTYGQDRFAARAWRGEDSSTFFAFFFKKHTTQHLHIAFGIVWGFRFGFSGRFRDVETRCFDAKDIVTALPEPSGALAYQWWL